MLELYTLLQLWHFFPTLPISFMLSGAVGKQFCVVLEEISVVRLRVYCVGGKGKKQQKNELLCR